jgi:hypothetical protein
MIAYPKALLLLAAVWTGLSATVRGEDAAPGANRRTTAAPATANEAEWRRQYDVLWNQLGNREWFARIAAQTHRREALVLPEDRDPLDIVLRRTRALFEHLQRMGRNLTAEQAELARLDQAARALPPAAAPEKPEPNAAAGSRYQLYLQTCRLRRKLALTNPLLDFEQVLFIKRKGVYLGHMCDMYHGFNAVPGGGLYVLDGAFTDQPKARDVLAGATPRNGRLQGRPLTPGAFLSPELSYDGRSILFAYSEAEHTPYVFTERSTYHIFRVVLDGSDLNQLTDGPWDDVDPCWLPDGRIAFISERRGGVGRCHSRPARGFTLHGMNPDGSQLACLSYHDSNEWQPSVLPDGRLVYSRWDYIDREAQIAHHPWVTTPDGRDARAVQGNYPPSRHLRPNMELSVRAIPGSHRWIATAAPHHGQAFGSLLLVDPAIPDDDLLAPLRRLTPESPFPETAERGSLAYGSAWPLSEDFFLCAYDPSAPSTNRGLYGLYLCDSLGNRELLYRDPEIGCVSPIPVKPRPRPPVVLSAPNEGPASFAVVNVYDGRTSWPPGTKITALRVVQVLPKPCVQPAACPPSESAAPAGAPAKAIACPSHHDGFRGCGCDGLPGSAAHIICGEPRINPGMETLARQVLGTVPVEADGSAYFEAPPGKELYFQALDEHGLAIQSMRSGTYLQPGERLVCQGCHNPRHRAPEVRGVPLAMRRGPSKIQPEADGSDPFSYPRLVQPVLDRHCVQCHAEKRDKAPDLSGRLAKELPHGWSASYVALIKHGFYYDIYFGSGQQDTTPRSAVGKIGARASKLYQLLAAGHHDVMLPPEDLRRLTLWLDCLSPFYGAYENTEAQARGEIVRPRLE